jgi:hypothetical protein
MAVERKALVVLAFRTSAEGRSGFGAWAVRKRPMRLTCDINRPLLE